MWIDILDQSKIYIEIGSLVSFGGGLLLQKCIFVTPTFSEVQLSVSLSICLSSIEPHHEKTCLMPYANNKGADQPAHLCSLISAFMVRCLDSNNIYTFYIQSFNTLAGFCS